MLIIRRFSHRHSRSFFIPNGKQIQNPLNECEKPCKQNHFYKCQNIVKENPLNECEKTVNQYNLNNTNKPPVQIYVYW